MDAAAACDGAAMGMMDKFEELAAQYLRLALRDVREGDQIPPSGALTQLHSTLELFLPLMMRESDPAHWRLEAFDAFRFPVARKTGPCEAELRGAGLLLSDETWTPIELRLRAAADADSIAWASGRVGDRRVPAEQRPAATSDLGDLLASVSEQPGKIEWAYAAEYPGRTADG